MQQRRWLRRFLRPALLFVILAIMWRWFEYSQVYHPSQSFDAAAGDLGRPFQDVYFTSSDGVKLNAWFFPAYQDPADRGFVFLVCHGNGGNISHRIGLYQALLNRRASVFAFDYRGYGRSAGRPSEQGTYRDAQAAYDWLRRKGFGPRQIIAYGESLGGGIAAELCLREAVGGLVLQSTFTSIPDIGRETFPWLPVRLLCTIHYDTQAKLPRLKIPVLVMHSQEDGLIGFHHAERNYAAANEPKFLCELTGGHNDPVWTETAFTGALDRFLRSLEHPPEAKP